MSELSDLPGGTRLGESINRWADRQELIHAQAQVAAIEALIHPDSGLGYTLVPGIRAFREKQIREALNTTTGAQA